MADVQSGALSCISPGLRSLSLKDSTVACANQTADYTVVLRRKGETFQPAVNRALNYALIVRRTYHRCNSGAECVFFPRVFIVIVILVLVQRFALNAQNTASSSPNATYLIFGRRPPARPAIRYLQTLGLSGSNALTSALEVRRT